MPSTTCQPTAAQQTWMALGYGMFIHFGPNTFSGAAWGDGQFPAAQFDPARLDTDQWADVAVEAGMRYAVLTAKHHDGFCLWPSRHTDYCTRHSPGQPDVVRRFADSFRGRGLKVGLYYSLWDRNYPRYEDDAAYADYMRLQLIELLADYGDVLELWFDGGWDKDHPTRQWPYDPAWERDPASGLTHGERWRWCQLYDHIHSLQPQCMVIHNSSSDRPGGVKYHPVDVRTAEHFHFVWQERVCEPDTRTIHRDDAGRDVFLPLEYCATLTPRWFWNEGSGYNHPSAPAIAHWRNTARQHHANLLLNLGPDKTGRIPTYHLPFLRAPCSVT